ncbi:DUF6010 family protein [Actinoplanes sp. NPDC051861]|uniref:DUF6010 family protein n=1 Tax=Actinoplanes sp. NPDC051861 TaxID=3155170 RepID=UPI0034288A48
MNVLVPILIGVAYVVLSSLIPDPHRRPFNAIMVGGAGAAYLSGGGLGVGEVAFAAVLAFVAFRGLTSWTWIGVGWLLHTAWDVVHHLRGEPILPFDHNSSFGCALCDPVIALWCLAGGPSLHFPRRSKQDETAGQSQGDLHHRGEDQPAAR